MPKVLQPVPEMTESVTRPIMFDVMRQLIEMTDLPRKINILFNGDSEKAKQLGSSIDLNPQDDPNKFAANDKITIEVEESYGPERFMTEPIFGPHNLFIFHDQALEIAMKPTYSSTNVTIMVKYRANNKNAAIRWRDMIKSRIAQRREGQVHNLTYSYQIPLEYLAILEHLHSMREKVDGYGDTFEQYWAANRHPKITELTNMAGLSSTWSVPETQMQVQGWFDFETPEVGGKDGEGDTWTISFAYKFNYERPVQMAMEYPLMIHNQLLSKKYRPPPQVTEDDVLKTYAAGTRVMSHWAYGGGVIQAAARDGYALPSYDEFIPASVPINTMRIITAMIAVDKDNPTLFWSLKNMGTKEFTPEMLAYLTAEAPYLTQPYRSAISVNFYRNSLLIDPTPLRVDANLDIYATTDINLRMQHHIRVSLVSDWFILNPAALERLREHGQACIQMLEALDPSLRARGYMPALIGDNYISKPSLLVALENLRPHDRPTARAHVMNTVQTLFVQAEHLPA